MIAKFNGIDVLQTRGHIKIPCHKYLEKVLDSHKWQECEPGVNPISIRDGKVYQTAIKTVMPPSDPGKQKELHDAHFNYRQVIGESIYVMVTCRPGISFAVIKLSQYSANPAEIRYKAAQRLMKYLALTKTRGITYWRQHILSTLPNTQNDPCVSRSETIPHHAATSQPHSFVDADWGGDRSHQRSVSGLMTILVEGVIA